MRANLRTSAGWAVLAYVAVFPIRPATAQVVDWGPHLINYQGRLTDSSGVTVPDDTYEITFTIWSDSISSAPQDRKWISPSCTVLVVNGLFNWQLGTRENLPPWTVTNDANLWVGTHVDSDPEIRPRTRLCSVPYAYKAFQSEWSEYADSAGMLAGGASAGCCQTRVGNVHGTGIIPVTFVPAFPPGVTPHVFAMAVLTATSGSMGKGACPYAEVSSVTNTGFIVTLKEEIGGSAMAAASADVHYLATE